MNRDEFAHLVRAAGRISGVEEMLVIGSQAILGSYDASELPDRTTMSREVDVAFWDDENNEISDKVDIHIGELSQFDEAFGVYAQGVSVTTARLPEGWRSRLIPFDSDGFRAWCLEPHDLALSKLAAHRAKDYEFVVALLDAGMLDIELLRARAETLPIAPSEVSAVTRWLGGFTGP